MSTPTESVIRLRAKVMTELAWPRIALVTAVFNSGKYIEQATQSVLAQRYLNLDYFNVDGGSTDGTVEIIRKDELQISRHSG
jgi:glycosyltransferase involved in cell wall biosynthesis